MRRVAAAVAALVVVLSLAGCAAGDGYSAATASTLQHGVLDVATSATGKDYAGALDRLDALEKANDAAAKAGRITAQRHDAIAASVSAVRADLERLKAAAEQAALQAQIDQLQQQQQQHQGPGKAPGGPGGKKKDG